MTPPIKHSSGAAIAEAVDAVINPDLEAQRAYWRKKLSEAGFDFGLMITNAFVRGIRDIGYKHTGTALDELIDNAIQAGAQNVHVVFGYDTRGTDKKPNQIAVIDDGHGMDPPMTRISVMWGGTHRETPTEERSSRKGFGRYGYGLPSASVSQGRRFTVFSATPEGDWHRVELDLDEMADGRYTNPATSRIEVPEPERAVLPNWLRDYLGKNDNVHGHHEGDLAHGTVVVLDKLDRLDWTTTTNLERHLFQHFGVVYRNYLRSTAVWLNGKRVDPVDPLFLTPGHRFFDLDEDRADARPPTEIAVKDKETGKPLGTMTARYAYLPPTFARMDKDKAHSTAANNNARMEVMREHNGFIFLREGRQIDVVTRNPWTTFQNNDRYVKVEVDFPSTLDEEFHITTSKQQVVPSERIWELLREAQVHKVLGEMRATWDKDNKILQERLEHLEADAENRRASERAMEEAEKFKSSRPGADQQARLEEAQRRLEDEARKRARSTGTSVEDARHAIEVELGGEAFKVVFDAMPGAPFYRAEQWGRTAILHINTAHVFYSNLYMGPESTPRLRAALEALLFVLGDAELDALDDRKLFYQQERAAWSWHLNAVLERLDRIRSVEDVTQAPNELVTDDANGGAEANTAAA